MKYPTQELEYQLIDIANRTYIVAYTTLDRIMLVHYTEVLKEYQIDEYQIA